MNGSVATTRSIPDQIDDLRLSEMPGTIDATRIGNTWRIQTGYLSKKATA